MGYNDNSVVKTVYDPSPVGFKMPASNAFTGFTTTGQNSYTQSELNVDGTSDWQTYQNNFGHNSGQAVVRLLLSTSLLRAIAITVVVRCTASATKVTIGRRFRVARATVATCSSTRTTCTRWATPVGLLGTRCVRSQNNT